MHFIRERDNLLDHSLPGCVLIRIRAVFSADYADYLFWFALYLLQVPEFVLTTLFQIPRTKPKSLLLFNLRNLRNLRITNLAL